MKVRIYKPVLLRSFNLFAVKSFVGEYKIITVKNPLSFGQDWLVVCHGERRYGRPLSTWKRWERKGKVFIQDNDCPT